MPRRVITAPAAAEGLRTARKWLMQPGSGERGRRRWEHLRDIRRTLRDWPYLGAASNDHPGCRYVACEEHYIIYEVVPDTGLSATAGDVIILAVFGPRRGSRDLPQP